MKVFLGGRGWGFPVVSFIAITTVGATDGAYQSWEREAGTNYPVRGPNKIVYRSPEHFLGEFGRGSCNKSVR